ncbi:MAG: NAD-dependent epimerase/dehydratase family protein, partial [Acidimicrobiales bacterium]
MTAAENSGPNPVAAALAPGDRVAVTGAAGFIGSAVTRRLLERDAEVVAVVEPGGDERNLDGLDVKRATADVRDARAVRGAVEGCRFVLHTAALYGFWAPDPRAFYDVNVVGTRNVLAAAAGAGCERLVYTSTVGTVGLDHTSGGSPANEDCHADIEHLFGHYKRSKYVAEHEVLRAAAQGAPVVLVLPTFPLGPRDRRPTPTGRLVLDFLNGRIPGFVDTSLNVAHVDDLADAHLLALERGAVGRSYIAGGENLSMQAMLATLAGATGLPVPARRFPRALALAAGAVSDLVEGRLLHREPFVAMEAARMSTTTMIFDDSRARAELGYASRPPAEALAASARWFAHHGYVRPDRLAMARWAGAE